MFTRKYIKHQYINQLLLVRNRSYKTFILAFTFSLHMFLVTSAAHSEDIERKIERSVLKNIMKENLLSFSRLEIPSLKHIKLVKNAENVFMGFRVYDGQALKNGGVRSEVSIDYPFSDGTVLEYSWRFSIPEDFPPDSSSPSFWSGTCSPENRWWIIAQWHDQPNAVIGETWEDFESRSPPIALGYGYMKGHDLISVSYGAPEPKPIALLPIERGRWNTMNVKILWSQTENGRIAITLNDNTLPILQYKGRNMHNAYQHYMKLGMYRHPNIQGDAWIYIDDIEIKGSTFE